MKTTILITLSLLTLATTLTACNTARGIGQDIEAAGEKIQSATTK